MIQFVARKVARCPGFSHIDCCIDCKVSVSNIFPKSTNELSKTTHFKHVASIKNNKKDYF